MWFLYYIIKKFKSLSMVLVVHFEMPGTYNLIAVDVCAPFMNYKPFFFPHRMVLSTDVLFSFQFVNVMCSFCTRIIGMVSEDFTCSLWNTIAPIVWCCQLLILCVTSKFVMLSAASVWAYDNVLYKWNYYLMRLLLVMVWSGGVRKKGHTPSVTIMMYWLLS